MPNLTVAIAGITFKNPVLPAAGPIVRDGQSIIRVAASGAGGIVTKTISTSPAEVPKPNMAVVPGGLINCELWSELSVEQWIEIELPLARTTGVPIIASIGYTGDQIAQLVKKLEPYVDGFELSTHYVGTRLDPIRNGTKSAKDNTDKPVLLKLSPQSEQISAAAVAAQASGADGLVAINSFGPVLAIDPKTKLPLLGSKNGSGWLSGKAIKSLALRCVSEIVAAVDIPVFGVGGISRTQDAIEMLFVGAQAVQICTAAILDGNSVFQKVVSGLEKYLVENNYSSIDQLVGLFKKQELIMTTAPELVASKCTVCGRCVQSCVYTALSIQHEQLVIDAEKCARCGLCITRCPTAALLIK
ncbi:MAG: 4Fe-4S binding protein [bacterium]|nr:4Fe-4S binding protein [bacterium]